MSAFLDSLSQYPRWFVIACATLAAVVAIWLLAKLLKFALWLILIAVVVGGAALVLWKMFH